MDDIVLVHGTTQSAEGFGPLVAVLRERGHDVHALRVPSRGATTSRGYAELLAAQLPDGVEHPVVLAHSASGLILPAFAQRVGASRQVWLAAAVADHAGQRSFLAEYEADPSAVVNEEWIGVDPTTDPVLATYFLFHDADLASLRAALPTLSHCDLSSVYAETPAADPRRLPSTYLLPEDDRTLLPAWMERVALERLGVAPTLIPGGHNCYVASPERIADNMITGLLTR